jgi:hypothetical protein
MEPGHAPGPVLLTKTSFSSLSTPTTSPITTVVFCCLPRISRRGAAICPVDNDADRDLIEQRLEHVMVAAIDQHDPDGSPSQSLGGSKPSEPSADDDDNRVLPSHSQPSSKATASVPDRF